MKYFDFVWFLIHWKNPLRRIPHYNAQHIMKSQQELFERFIQNECTMQEIESLLAAFADAGNEAALREIILTTLSKAAAAGPAQLPDLDAKEQAIYAALRPQLITKRTFALWPRIAAAASILLVLSAGGYFLLHKNQPQQQIAQNQIHDIAPGRNQATLTLANGKKIILTKSLNGKLAQQGNTIVHVNNANAIAYTVSGTETDRPVQYNTMSTGRGEQSPYPLVLADGTKVWLDAASSITFPTTFNGKGRTVKITGKAYFEVAHRPAQHFSVNVRGQVIEDIGTAFNISAYDDEPVIRTTLITGEVKVSLANAPASGILLKPGQQAVNDNNSLQVEAADVEMAVAWRNGLFQYQNADLQTVMRDIARWYDADVEYEGAIPAHEFSGKLQRDLNVSQVLDLLRFMKVHFRIEGKKIIVTPN
jgi:transmembrane sensor